VEIGSVLTALVGAIAASFAIVQYKMQNRQKRAEMFFSWNKWFDSKEGFGVDTESKIPSVLQLLENDDERLKSEVPWEKREALLAFYEEIALAVQSDLLHEDTANYMFGYYAVKIKTSTHFWIGLDDPKEGYWKLFRDFAERMEAQQKKLGEECFNPRKLRF
jgi:hypothetical protein